jgi:hypothetical protein
VTLRRIFSLFGLLLALVCAGMAAAPSSTPVLPDFDGWHKVQSTVLTQPGWNLPANESALMKELGLKALERVAYQRGDRHMKVEAFFFGDASGAYGAYTFLRPENYHPFDVGQPRSQGVSGNTDIYFYRGQWAVYVQVDQLTAMTGREMRQLASQLPMFTGQQSQLPTLPMYLPHTHYRTNSVRYMEGPAGMAQAAPWMPVQAAGFDMGAEAVTGTYDVPAPVQAAGPDQPNELVILSYPTPDIARDFLHRLQQALKVGQPGSPNQIRRSGPVVAVLHGPNYPGASDLLNSVNYDAEVTMTQPTPIGLEGLPGLILGIFALAGMVIAVAIVVGIMTGGLRVFLRRRFPKWFKSEAEERELIRLHLR